MTQLAKAWNAVHDAAKHVRKTHLRDLFAGDPDRFADFSSQRNDLLVDFSKEKLDRAALGALLALAAASELEARRDAMFEGRRINETEGRPALHTALRAGPAARVEVDGRDVMGNVRETLGRFLEFAEAVRAGAYASASGAPFSHVVNIGIGGSDLGPAMTVRALAPYHDGPQVEFVSNVDGAHLAEVVAPLNPARTLVITASKTFTTPETMANARSAREWLAAGLGDAASRNMAAISAITASAWR